MNFNNMNGMNNMQMNLMNNANAMLYYNMMQMKMQERLKKMNEILNHTDKNNSDEEKNNKKEKKIENKKENKVEKIPKEHLVKIKFNHPTGKIIIEASKYDTIKSAVEKLRIKTGDVGKQLNFYLKTKLITKNNDTIENLGITNESEIKVTIS